MLRKHPARTEAELNFISLFWPRLPSGIQAAYENIERDEITFFKGNSMRRSPLFLTCYKLRGYRNQSIFKEVKQIIQF